MEHLDGAMEIIRWFDKIKKDEKTSSFWKSAAQFPQQIESWPYTVTTVADPADVFLNMRKCTVFGSLIPLWRNRPRSVPWRLYVYNDIEEVVTVSHAIFEEGGRGG